jgi:hypothetical protein
LNFLKMSSAVVDPDLNDFEMRVRQVAPGRYVGEFDADKAGSYLVTISPGQGKAPLLAGVNVPYSAEYRDRETNEPLLTTLAGLQPTGGEAGKVLGKLEGDRESLDKLLAADTFRGGLAKAISRQDFWPLVLVLAAGVFFGDVFVRRVTVHFYWLGPLLMWVVNRLLRREQAAAPDERLQRLRSRKAAIAEQLDERRAAARFEPQPDREAAAQPLEDVVQAMTAPAAGPAPRAEATPPQPAEDKESYTSRLLEAKKKAWKDKSS